MPLYEYECEACGATFEVIQRFSDPPIAVCRQCGGPVHKLLSAPAIHFKGTGWYVTDYAKGGGPGSKTQSSDEAKAVAEAASSSAKSDSGTKPAATDTKPATKTD